MKNISVIKVVSIYSEMIWYHVTVDSYHLSMLELHFLYFWAKFLSEKKWHASFLPDITQRTYACQIKQLTLHFDISFELA